MGSRRYKIFFTGKGRNTYNHCVDYVLYHFEDAFAAERLNIDIQKALNFLELSPEARPICENSKLHERGIRKIHLRRYAYKLYYHVVGDEVYIDALIHDRQDVGNVLG